MSWRLGVLISHPIQYYSPWFCYLAKRLDIEVFYAHRQDPIGQADAGFGVEFEWDIPLLEGYSYRWLTNVASRPNVATFGGCDTPELYDLIRKDRFDAFLIFGWNRKSAIQAIRACWRNNVPALMRSDSQLMSGSSWIKSTVKYFPYRWFLPRLAGHLYVGKRNKQYLQYYQVPDDKLFFVPHFIDNDFFAKAAQNAQKEGLPFAIRERFGIPHDAFVFTFTGKMSLKKRPEDFLRACLNIFNSPSGTDLHALLIGDGPLRPALELLAEPYKDRIHFAGFCNQTQLPAFYKASDALVLPSDRKETWGLVVNEAFACSIPAIVSDAVGCTPDIIEEGVTGYSYTVGNVEQLSNRMLTLKAIYKENPIAIQRAVIDKVASYSIPKATEGLWRALEVVTSRMASTRTVLSDITFG